MLTVKTNCMKILCHKFNVVESSLRTLFRGENEPTMSELESESGTAVYLDTPLITIHQSH